MRQVGQAELAQNLKFGVSRLSVTLLKQLKHHDTTIRLRAELMVAEILAKRLDRYEILTSAPEGPPVHYAALDGGSGIPPQNPEDIPPATTLF